MWGRVLIFPMNNKEDAYFVPQETESANQKLSFFEKLIPTGQCPPRPAPAELIWAAIGSVAGIGMVSFLALHYQLPLLVASFGATAVLIYGAVDSPFAQPRNVIGGHLFSALIGVMAYQFLGASWWSITLAVSLSIVVMLFTRTVHPPGGATAIVAVWTGQGYYFILTPVLAGAAALVLTAVIVNNLAHTRCYPKFWL